MEALWKLKILLWNVAWMLYLLEKPWLGDDLKMTYLVRYATTPLNHKAIFSFIAPSLSLHGPLQNDH